jgi:hypothetical protein
MAKLASREQILDAEMSLGMARLNRIARRVREGKPQDTGDMVALAVSFEKIVAGIEPKKALGIDGKRSQGRKPMTGAEAGKWFARVVRVEELRAAGMPREDAIDEAALEHHCARDSLDRWHKRNRASALSALRFISERVGKK